jgi:hypothetical protein
VVEDAAPEGWFLVLFDLFAGTVCCCLAAGSWPSATSATLADTLVVTTAGIAGASMVVAGLCLRVRQPWNWRAGSIAQLVAGVAYASLAIVAFWLSQRPNEGGRYACGLDTLAYLARCVSAAVPAAVSFVGFIYLLQPCTKRAFGFDAPP